MALSSSEQTTSNISCNRCGASIAAKVQTYDTFHVYCAPCNALMSQEALSFKKKADTLEKENKMLREKQEMYDSNVAKLKNRAESVEKAYTEEAKEHLEIRVQRDWARNAIMYWKSFLDHWKVKAGCPFCATNQACQTIKLIEEQALSATPEWDCDGCKKKEAECAMFKTATTAWSENERHLRNCNRCVERFENLMHCDDERDLHRTLQHHMAVADNSESGQMLLNKMGNIIREFSFLGDGSAIMYEKSAYHIIKIDTKKVKAGDVTYLAVGPSPKAALEKAKRSQTIETMQHGHQSLA